MEWIVGLFTGLLGAFMGAAAAGVPLYLKLKKGVRQIRKEERADIEAEWQRAFDREVARSTRIGAELDREIAHRRTLEAKIEELKQENYTCHENYAKLSSQMTILSHQVEQLQRIAVAPQVTLVARIVADLDGVVVDSDEWVSDILGWTRRELIGQNVDAVIPPELRARHRSGLERVKMSDSVRPSNTGITTTALTKHGDRIPVVVTLDLREADGKKHLVAQIVHRKVLSIPDSGSGVHHALPDSGIWTTPELKKEPPK